MDCSIMLVHCAIYHSIFAPFLNLYRLLEFFFLSKINLICKLMNLLK